MVGVTVGDGDGILIYGRPPSTYVSSSTEGTLYIDLIDAKKKISLARRGVGY
jgi:hypothetical protein